MKSEAERLKPGAAGFAARLPEVVELLRRHTGLMAEALNSSAVTGALERRQLALHVDPEEYVDRLKNSVREWDAFVDEIVVPETWFFRDVEPFKHFRRWALDGENRKQWTRRRLRILSAPCATGEEPYSIAMVLLDAGYSARDFHIDAVDISHAALKKARAGIFRPRAFRGEAPVRKGFFEPHGGDFALSPNVLSAVHFHYGNIVDPKFLAAQDPYDAIFCRNALIYFDAPARKVVAAMIDRLLTETGVLYLGHADPTQHLSPRFAPLAHARSFAYGRASALAKAAAPVVPAARPHSQSRARTAAKSGLRTAVAPGPVATAAPATSRKAEAVRELVSESAALADAGKLKEAEARLQEALKRDPASAEAWRLLGMIFHSRGEEAPAEAALTKSLYLQPECVESMTHLALIYESQGRRRDAAAMRSRALRMEQKRRAV